MKKYFSWVVTLIFAVTVVSCDPDNNDFKYRYNYQPVFSWGYAEFFGPYYSNYDVEKNIVSLSLFTDSLSVDNQGNLAGFGQYLFLEDVFIAPDKVLLPEGTYKCSEKMEEFNFTPGSKLKIDSLSYPIGAFVMFVEKQKSRSVIRYIKSGNLSISYIGDKMNVNGNLQLDNDSILTTTFSSTLPYYNSSPFDFLNAPRLRRIKTPEFIKF